MLMKFGAVVLYAPTFLFPSIVIAFIGGWIGNTYMKAQLSVKREMSNAKAPVLGMLNGAISGLSESIIRHIEISTLTSRHHSFFSFDSCIRRTKPVQKRDSQEN